MAVDHMRPKETVVDLIVRKFAAGLQIFDNENHLQLHIATLTNDSGEIIFSLLSEFHEAIKIPGPGEKLALHLAVERGDPFRLSEGHDEYMDAVENDGYVPVAKRLGDSYREAMTIKDAKGLLPLHYAMLKPSGSENDDCAYCTMHRIRTISSICSHIVLKK
jgi:hypothetical protein